MNECRYDPEYSRLYVGEHSPRHSSSVAPTTEIRYDRTPSPQYDGYQTASRQHGHQALLQPINTRFGMNPDHKKDLFRIQQN